MSDEGINATTHKEERMECRDALLLLFKAAADCLPYLEACYRNSKVGSPDWFHLPVRIKTIYEALEAGRKILNMPEEDEERRDSR